MIWYLHTTIANTWWQQHYFVCHLKTELWLQNMSILVGSVQHHLQWNVLSVREALPMSSGKTDPFPLIPYVRNVKLHDRLKAPPHRILSVLYISLLSVKLYQEVWVILHSHYHYQSVWKYARPDTYLLVSLMPFPEQNEAKLASRISWSNSRAYIHAKCTST